MNITFADLKLFWQGYTPEQIMEIRKGENMQVVHTEYMNNAYIYVTFDFEGFHRYPTAPDVVGYLRNIHRHIFKVRVDIQVHHDDREIEFHMFKNFLTKIPIDNNLDFMSCEMLCDFFHDKICEEYGLLDNRELGTPTRKMTIEVSEDGECGAVKVYGPQNIRGTKEESLAMQRQEAV